VCVYIVKPAVARALPEILTFSSIVCRYPYDTHPLRYISVSYTVVNVRPTTRRRATGSLMLSSNTRAFAYTLRLCIWTVAHDSTDHAEPVTSLYLRQSDAILETLEMFVFGRRRTGKIKAVWIAPRVWRLYVHTRKCGACVSQSKRSQNLKTSIQYWSSTPAIGTFHVYMHTVVVCVGRFRHVVHSRSEIVSGKRTK
jgi:hypothetical protein